MTLHMTKNIYNVHACHLKTENECLFYCDYASKCKDLGGLNCISIGFDVVKFVFALILWHLLHL